LSHDKEEFYLVGYNPEKTAESQPVFQRKMLTPSSGSKDKPSSALAASCISCLAYSTVLVVMLRHVLNL
jgi:hypothetical protein